VRPAQLIADGEVLRFILSTAEAELGSSMTAHCSDLTRYLAPTQP